eukprot:scaffold573785_cov52-Prasinocladus_malaysianus.AAC.1
MFGVCLPDGALIVEQGMVPGADDCMYVLEVRCFSIPMAVDERPSRELSLTSLPLPTVGHSRGHNHRWRL